MIKSVAALEAVAAAAVGVGLSLISDCLIIQAWDRGVKADGGIVRLTRIVGKSRQAKTDIERYLEPRIDTSICRTLLHELIPDFDNHIIFVGSSLAKLEELDSPGIASVARLPSLGVLRRRLYKNKRNRALCILSVKSPTFGDRSLMTSSYMPYKTMSVDLKPKCPGCRL